MLVMLVVVGCCWLLLADVAGVGGVAGSGVVGIGVVVVAGDVGVVVYAGVAGGCWGRLGEAG